LQYAAKTSQLIIVTGGLGPTDNDITREVLSEFTGLSLREHPEVLAHMARRFRTPADRLLSNLRRQARVPVQGTYLDNTTGTAVGLVFEWNKKVVVALPGPPRELQPMVERPLKSYLANRYGVRANGCSLTLRFVGLGQSRIDQTLEDHIHLPNETTLATQFTDGRVDFTFSLPDDSTESRALLDKLKNDLQTHLGDFIYATDKATSLEQCVVELLSNRRETLSVMEIGSGGSVVAAISGAGEQPPNVLDAGYVASSSLRLLAMFRDDSSLEKSAKNETDQLAELVASRNQSSWLVVIGARREEQGNGFVEVVFRQPNEQIETIRLPLRDNGRSSRSRLTTMVLDQLRRRLQRAK
jgi:nicotinamide-nucleotide amidase